MLAEIAVAGISISPAMASSYKYATFDITLTPPGDINVTGIDAAGNVDGYISAHHAKIQYAFAYVNGKLELATPVGGSLNSYALGMSSTGIAIIYEGPTNTKKYNKAMRWDVVANKLTPLYAKGAPKLNTAEYINAGGDLVGACSGGACLDVGDASTLMTQGAYDGNAWAYGLNDNGASGGDFLDASKTPELFIYVNGVESVFSIPGATEYSASGSVLSTGALAGNLCEQVWRWCRVRARKRQIHLLLISWRRRHRSLRRQRVGAGHRLLFRPKRTRCLPV